MNTFYLGPIGTFTHQAAQEAADVLSRDGYDIGQLIACDSIPEIVEHVEACEGWGVIAWENNVEGYVVPNLDAMIDSANIAGFARVGVNVSFDAFVTPETFQYACSTRDDNGAICEDIAQVCTEVTAHPHGLAQCKHFIDSYSLTCVPASSNGAACRDLSFQQVGLGPEICAQLYGLQRIASHVEDFSGARTEFLVIASRSLAQHVLQEAKKRSMQEFESIVTFIPLVTGPGVLANLLDILRDAGLNMTSFISRPIKGHDGTYSFIATLDAAPWESRFQDALNTIIKRGDWVKTLAVYPRRECPHPPVDEWMLPQGGVRFNAKDVSEAPVMDASIRKELLW